MRATDATHHALDGVALLRRRRSHCYQSTSDSSLQSSCSPLLVTGEDASCYRLCCEQYGRPGWAPLLMIEQSSGASLLRVFSARTYLEVGEAIRVDEDSWLRSSRCPETRVCRAPVAHRGRFLNKCWASMLSAPCECRKLEDQDVASQRAVVSRKPRLVSPRSGKRRGPEEIARACEQRSRLHSLDERQPRLKWRRFDARWSGRPSPCTVGPVVRASGGASGVACDLILVGLGEVFEGAGITRCIESDIEICHTGVSKLISERPVDTTSRQITFTDEPSCAPPPSSIDCPDVPAQPPDPAGRGMGDSSPLAHACATHCAMSQVSTSGLMHDAESMPGCHGGDSPTGGTSHSDGAAMAGLCLFAASPAMSMSFASIPVHVTVVAVASDASVFPSLTTIPPDKPPRS